VDIKVICGFGKPEPGWTTQITLIRLTKLDFTRKSVGTRRPTTGIKPAGRHDWVIECAVIVMVRAVVSQLWALSRRANRTERCLVSDAKRKHMLASSFSAYPTSAG
jgi:hypothetical protein